MSDLKINQLDKSYHKVIDDLHEWKTKLNLKVDEMYENILIDMSQTLDDVHYFASFTNALLIEYENQLEKTTSNEEINLLEERINQITTEIELLQSLSFHLNCESVQLPNKLQLNYNNNDIKSLSLTPINNNYRFLISKSDALELEKRYLSIFHLNSSDNECVLTFNVPDLDTFVPAFNTYWDLFPNHNEIRLLIPQYNISFMMGKLGETSRLLAKRFQLDQIKVFTNLCPKSDERVLLITGQQRDLIKNCIEEIYFNLEEKNRNNSKNVTIQYYNPSNLSIDDILKTNLDYGGFIQHTSQLHSTEDEESTNDDDDDELWNENDNLWHNQDDDNSDIIQREITMNNNSFIGINTTRINRIKQKTGAYIYINDETNDLKRTVIMRGTRGQIDRACTYIENLIEKYKK